MSLAKDHISSLDGIDEIDLYFECITSCSIDDQGSECVTRCVEKHLKQDST